MTLDSSASTEMERESICADVTIGTGTHCPCVILTAGERIAVSSVLRAAKAERNLDILETIGEVETEVDNGMFGMKLDDDRGKVDAELNKSAARIEKEEGDGNRMMDAELDEKATRLNEDDAVGDATPFCRVLLDWFQRDMRVISSIFTTSFGQSLRKLTHALPSVTASVGST